MAKKKASAPTATTADNEMEQLAARMTELLQATSLRSLRNPAGYDSNIILTKFAEAKMTGSLFREYPSEKYSFEMDAESGVLTVKQGKGARDTGFFTATADTNGESWSGGYKNYQPTPVVKKLKRLAGEHSIELSATDSGPDTLTINAYTPEELRSFLKEAIPLLEKHLVEYANKRILPERRKDRIERMRDYGNGSFNTGDGKRIYATRVLNAAEEYFECAEKYRKENLRTPSGLAFEDYSPTRDRMEIAKQMIELETVLIDGFRALAKDKKSAPTLERIGKMIRFINTLDDPELEKRIKTLQAALKAAKKDELHTQYHSR